MKSKNPVFLVLILIVLLSGQNVFAQEEEQGNQVESIITDIASFIGNTITEIITVPTKIAGEIVQESIGIDFLERGYDRRRKHEPLPDCASDVARQELADIHQDYTGEIKQFERELGQEILKEEAEFENNVADGDSRRKVNTQKRLLERKVDEAYKRFDQKVIDLNAKYDVKRDDIIRREQESERCA